MVDVLLVSIRPEAPWPNLRESKLAVTELMRRIVDSDEASIYYIMLYIIYIYSLLCII